MFLYKCTDITSTNHYHDSLSLFSLSFISPQGGSAIYDLELEIKYVTVSKPVKKLLAC